MDAQALRRAWTEFFAAREHTVLPSSSLIPTHPTAPMFTNSGMMQFVPVFLGEEPVGFAPARAATVQKCVRAGGKHNDLDAIGRTPRHLSFFEMLGNFSFGDYFKQEAIPWAWELLTEVLGLDGDRMWVTVHVSDDEAEEIWADAVGFPRDRIQRLDKDNFWEMGDTGPCGPSSEIFWDYGTAFGPAGGPGNPAAEDRYVEIWNLVFPQYFRGHDGNLSELPRRGIDTGAGLERMLTALNGTHTVYDVDPLDRLVEVAQSITGRRLGSDERTDIALKVLADHARSMTFLVADGIVPSNEDRGYVLRRIIRRAVRYAYLLGLERDLAAPLIGATVEAMADGYPELPLDQDRIVGIIAREEDRFRQTLKRGINLLDGKLAELPAGRALGGDVAFDLYETYGFPLEVTQEITGELGIAVDEAGYEDALLRAQTVSKAGAKAAKDLYANLTSFQEILDRAGPTEFVGRDEFETKAVVLAVVPADDGTLSVFLDRTPFYAESGGQVGDTGVLVTDTGRGDVLDTTFGLPGLHRHHVRVSEGELQVGQDVTAAIDVDRRNAIRRNHTGTHVLHFALRKVLGESVKQQGSHVDPERLRFDFGPADALTPEQIRQIEDIANREILANDPVRHYETTKAEAANLGAIAFFGDKYGEVVRVLEAGRHSIELCGGTHVRALGDIGPVKIVTESSIGANLRRIEAVTGLGPIDRLRAEERVLAEVAATVNVPVGEVVEGVRKRIEEIKALREEIKALKQQAAGGQATALAGRAVDGVIVERIEGVERDTLRDLALSLRDQPGMRAVVLGTAPESGGAAIVAAVNADSGLHASALIEEAKALIKGGGGKDPLLAVAGGKDAGGLDAALDTVRAAAGLPVPT
ncbi:MAG: alanine--tRNA ligase [Acidimicrobiales bacterium]|nr:alanine--tRNA ligase [Acidimicrobiales bacterium]